MDSPRQQQTAASRVFEALRIHGPKDDDELSFLLGIDRHHVNQVARSLEQREVLKRSIGPSGKLINVLLPDAELPTPSAPAAKRDPGKLLAEDTVKRVLYSYLEQQGYSGTVRWGRDPGIDIDVSGPDGRLIIEAKGEATLSAQQANYFPRRDRRARAAHGRRRGALSARTSR